MKRTIFEPEHEQFREAVRAFLIKEAVPHSDEWEEAGMVDRDFWRRAAAQGLVGFAAPEEFGGGGLRDFRFNAVLNEEVVRTGTVGDGFSLTNDIVLPYFLDLADEAQQKRWLPDIVSGERTIAVSMSEPGTGSDLRAIKTTARREGPGWRITGSKTFVTSGMQADLVIVAARIPDEDGGGFGLFVVEDGQPGFERGRKLSKIGRKAQDTAELFFQNVEVQAENVLGEPGKGLRYLMANLAQERLSMAVVAVASAEYALELALSYAKERRAFGSPIGSFQANRFTLAELSTKVQIARIYLDRCLDAHGNGELTAADAAGAKFWTTELEFEALDTCLQLHGGYGYMEEYEVARRWRDSRVQQIYGGTNQIMREIVGRSLGL
ncbi:MULTISPECIES: acyl-CoA dehydrogenase family protein [Rhodococcus]|uniref:Acyl-CoA dehydrogenase family protein n=1 Tax=Rhodococcus oxybenzonivorans TaxID=1990687 RepID=A0AAE4UXW3_9NOCA|nr:MULTISPECIES: acyl-CoA dehydrogenase family protein [Rhodococcus]MDV7243653.1 acyl-CoA dehydrogenase family protein [Rhodococcus oxybenzonivorans]MDV7264284.1 acyl-CoA dehydrogenase family protein [Rhodococcus oxybenzonivorans]MDV7275105.1 acyl-CoA dehydrogenase family protein [Rhodococcus oxybenzonivorans]MDV7335343.1 acyl-CoA dehydrogenase family protein [Rhodococcus oxybenzonivorans]MDV7346054.1 acyl-CoA dehydrogenase family protein [Rhodococcus oxybenzonivorans]